MNLNAGIIAQAVAGGGYVPPVAALFELVYDNNGTTGTGGFSFMLDPGEEYQSRAFLITWVANRVSTTGSIIGNTCTFDGMTLPQAVATPYTQIEQKIAFVYHPTGIDPVLVELAMSSGSARVQNIRVFRMGAPTRPTALIQAINGAVNSSSSLSVPFDTPSGITLEAVVSIIRGDATANVSQAWLTEIGSQNLFSVAAGSNNFRGLSYVGVVPEGESAVGTGTSVSGHGKALSGAVITDQGIAPPPFDKIYNYPPNLMYHFDASQCYSDTLGTLCIDGEGVRVANNSGSSSADFEQPTTARQPTWRESGANGHPYIECDRTTQQYFNDLLDIGQPSGVTGITGYTVAGVIELTDLAAIQPLLGGANSANSKAVFAVNTSGSFWAIRNNLTIHNIGAGELVAFVYVASNYNAARAYEGRSYGTASNNNNLVSAAVSSIQCLRHTGQPAYFHGKLYEFTYWRQILSQFQTWGLVEGLREKYGIPA